MMDYCTYHPLAPATFSCSFCHTRNCDHCADEGDRGEDPACFSCARPLEELGAVNQATPFWRRLQESFYYPLKASPLVLILVVSVLSAVLADVPFGFVFLLALTGAFLKYSFTCLENTSRGLLVPPDITEAYSGGLVVLIHMVAMLFVAGGTLFATLYYLGPQLAAVVAILMVIAMPAVIIVYGLTESLTEALNPLAVLRLIASVGLPYGLLLGFILIMSGSVGLISQLIGDDYALASTVLQSIVGNYYTLVMFHIMGYMIFQYQGALGFTAREDFGEGPKVRSPRDRLAAHIQIKLKEGDYNAVVALYETALKDFPGDREFQRQYFEFLYATNRNLDDAASRYLHFLVRSGQDHQLGIIYKRVIHLLPNYMPNSPDVRHRLAMVCKSNGDSKSVVRLINGLHKAFPQYPRLVQAFQLMTEALEDLPHQQEQADKCRQFTAKLAAQAQAQRQKSAGRAVFDSRSPDSAPQRKPPEPAEPGPRRHDAQSRRTPGAQAEPIHQGSTGEVPAKDSSGDLAPIEFV